MLKEQNFLNDQYYSNEYYREHVSTYVHPVILLAIIKLCNVVAAGTAKHMSSNTTTTSDTQHALVHACTQNPISVGV